MLLTEFVVSLVAPHKDQSRLQIAARLDAYKSTSRISLDPYSSIYQDSEVELHDLGSVVY